MQEHNKKLQTNLIKAISVCMIIILLSAITIMASESDETCLVPSDNQYFELRAVKVKTVDGQNKQVIMELWGNNIEFKRV